MVEQIKSRCTKMSEQLYSLSCKDESSESIVSHEYSYHAHEIVPEDFGWSNDLDANKFKCSGFNINLENENKCMLPLTVCKSMNHHEIITSSNACSESALKCLYKTEQSGESDLHFNSGTAFKVEKELIALNYENQSHNFACNSTGKESDSWCVNSQKEGSFLQKETMSLIKDGITGIYASQDLFFTNDDTSNSHEQVVPMDNVELDFNEDQNMYFNPDKNDIKYMKNDGVMDNDYSDISCSSQTANQSKSNCSAGSPDLMIKTLGDNLDNERPNKIPRLTEDTIPLEKQGNLEESLSHKPKELLVFTPGGQMCRLRSEITPQENIKAADKDFNAISILVNQSKKSFQIQSGKFIPRELDYMKEEMFHNWLRKEKEKISSLIKKLDMNLNISHLTAERELLKLDRNLKQYALSNPRYASEALGLVEKCDIKLTNLVRISQIYETIQKVSNIKEGKLGGKAKSLMKKLQALISSPKGIKPIDCLNELCNKEDVPKLNHGPPSEWIVRSSVI